MIDLHCHLLPGLDDGPADARAAMALARLLLRQGVEIVLATPHFLDNPRQINREIVLERTRDLQTYLAGVEIRHEDRPVGRFVQDSEDAPSAADLTLSSTSPASSRLSYLKRLLSRSKATSGKLGAGQTQDPVLYGVLEVIPAMEVLVSPTVPALLDKGVILTVGDGGRYLLLELPPGEFPSYTEQVIFELGLRGITTILAHPERNYHLASDLHLAETLVDRGVLFQLNSGSLLGNFGTQARRAAHNLLKRGLVYCLGSDAHGSGRPPRLREAVDMVAALYGPDLARCLCLDNPRTILAGEGDVYARPN